MAIQINPAHKGLLHKKLGMKAGAPIPLATEEKAAHSSSPKERKEAQFAINARSWNKGGKKKKASSKMGPRTASISDRMLGSYR